MTPDLILLNADIRTMDEARPRARALAITRGRITALGSDDAIAALAGPATGRIDAGGRLCLPGLQDAHIHLLHGGADIVQTAQLYDATTPAELQAALAAHAAAFDGPMIWGAGWQFGFFNAENLTRALLDAVVPDRPCLVYDGNFHNACINSRACEMAGVVAGMEDPLNGHVVRDPSGEPTGMLYEEAITWVRERLPQTSDATWHAGLRAGMAHANRHGITGVLDASVVEEQLLAYPAAAAAGTMTLRAAGAHLITAADTVETALARLHALRAAHPGGHFHVHSAKFFLDGGFENRTAATVAPYADPPGGNAPLMFTPDQIRALFTAIDAARFQIHVHCIGDMATRAALDGFAAARAANGAWPSLHQIAHVQLVHPDDIPRFAELGVMANMQPLWAAHDPIIPDETMDMIGPDRAPFTYAFRRLIDAGAPWCVNSDWPVTTLNPFEIMGTAITREPARKRGRSAPFFPAERITIAEAVLGYTRNAAAACWREGYSGMLRPGFSADLILLDRDIFTCDPYEVAETEVLLTLFEGREVHRSGRFDR